MAAPVYSLQWQLNTVVSLPSHFLPKLGISAIVKQARAFGADLGLPVNFRSRLCNDHPDKFKVVDTCYGRARELVLWDSSLAQALPSRDEDKSLGLIVDRPLKFKHLRLQKGLNVKRRLHEYLIKFKEVPDVCPYTSNPVELAKESMAAEKRACAVVREVLGMTVEKRTLVDHLMHFRKEFGLSNQVRGMLVRHPELFHVSLKGQRDCVFLVEGYNDKGRLLEKDGILVMKLVIQGKRLRREGRKEHVDCDADDLFQKEDVSSEHDDDEGWIWNQDEGELWSAEKTPLLQNQNECGSVPW